jgi:hypothetical protein
MTGVAELIIVAMGALLAGAALTVMAELRAQLRELRAASRQLEAAALAAQAALAQLCGQLRAAGAPPGGT